MLEAFNWPHTVGGAHNQNWCATAANNCLGDVAAQPALRTSPVMSSHDYQVDFAQCLFFYNPVSGVAERHPRFDGQAAAGELFGECLQIALRMFDYRERLGMNGTNQRDRRLSAVCNCLGKG